MIEIVEQKLGLIPNWKAYPILRSQYDWLLELEDMLPQQGYEYSEVKELEKQILYMEKELTRLKIENEELNDEIDVLKN